jgi:O-antigen ligase
MSLASAVPAPAAQADARATVFDVLEACAVLLVMLLMAGTVVPHLIVGADLGENAKPVDVLRLIWPPAYAIILAASLTRLHRFGSIWVGVALTLPLLLLALASTAWSLDPETTLRRSIALVFTSMFGFYLAARYGWRALMELIAAVAVITALGSFLISVAAPSIGVHAELHAGAWKGLFIQKNELGNSMVRGALACLCAAALAPARRLLWLAGMALCAILVIASTSTTALLGLLLVFGGALGLAAVRTGGLGGVVVLWSALLAAVGVAALMTLAPDLFFSLVGKDPSLTGRTNIWEVLLRESAQRPLFGYGYQGFWGVDVGPAERIQTQLEWPVPSAHNGWLEILIQLGWVGVSLFALHFLLIATAAAGRLWSGREAYWPLLFVITLALLSISEDPFLQQNSLAWVLYVATFCKLLQGYVHTPPASPHYVAREWEQTRLA